MSKSLPDRVSQLYYGYGVLCAGHPVILICLTAAVVLLSCIPLVNVPLPSNIPQTIFEADNLTDLPRWYADFPVYIQQVTLKSAVSPWTEDMQLTDAIRAPLAEVFRLKEAIQNYVHPRSRLSLTEVCTHVEMSSRPEALPQYTCLVVSPANFWQNDPSRFYEDISLGSTVYSQYTTQVGKVPLAELLFGMGLREAGMKRYPLRTRQRVIQYAVTIAMVRHDKEYLDGLREHLYKLYPLLPDNSTSDVSSVLHLYYAGDFDFHEFLPLFCTYLALFFYMYFSVRKIELVRSKVGMALSAVFTVIASLMMSIGLCLFFGLDPAGSTRGREVFPYLVVVVGLENILVLTKSVLSTPDHLDSKIRLAQGLAKEGWGITKNLLTEVTILTVGLFTLLPSIQEFCIFAMVGLLCDFFLQMFFFSTLLSLDMAAGVSSDLRHGLITSSSSSGSHHSNMMETTGPSRPLPRTRSVPRLEGKLPKRLRLVLFWGRTRIVQRGFMICMVVWIGGFLYSAGIVSHLVQPSEAGGRKLSTAGRLFSKYDPLLGRESEATVLGIDTRSKASQVTQVGALRMVPHGRLLAPVKWCYLVGSYNTTGGPCRLALLPPIRLSAAVSPARALALRNPLEPPTPVFKWDKLALALDPSDEAFESEDLEGGGGRRRGWEAPYLPTSPLEVLIVTALSVISVIVISYTGLVLYHCVCSRHYADWRTRAWWQRNREQVVLEAVSVPLDDEGISGRAVESLTTDGNSLACSYLSGEIGIWDVTTAALLAFIDRKRYFGGNLVQEEEAKRRNSSSPQENRVPLRRETVWERTFPDLRGLINTRFTGCDNPEVNNSSETGRNFSQYGFDYGSAVQNTYLEASAIERIDDVDEHEEEEMDLYRFCPQIWCLHAFENIIAAGTSSGRIEFWEATTGQFKCMYEDGSGVGVTHVKMTSSRVVLARLSGTLEILRIDWGPRSAHSTYRRFGGHTRSMSAGGLDDFGPSELRLKPGSILRAHRQPITVLEVESGRIVTGSQDHIVRVLSLQDEILVFSLHAHHGPITALFIDSVNPLTAGSGSQDGGLCVWDLLTGACVYSLTAHDGRVQALTYSPSYVISLGSDERLCVWDRFQGHLLNTVTLANAFCTSMVMLTHHLLVTSQQGSLVVRDVRSGEAVRLVRLGHQDQFVSVSQILPLRSGVACDYGNTLRIVCFPLVRDKSD